jgi:ParB-like chromosome segregation protein Spo0J
MSKQREEAQAGMLAGAIAGTGQSVTDRKMAAQTERSRMAAILPITSIRSRAIDTRPVSAAEVLMMAESIVAVGLLGPPCVDRNHVLIAGAHRVAAARLLIAPPHDRRAYLAGIEGFTEEMSERIDALPPLDQLPEQIAGGKMPVLVRTDLDAVADPAGALAAEAAENTARKQYTPAQVRTLAERLVQAGFRESVGRPKKGEKALRPALEKILGVNGRQVRRLLGQELEGERKQADLASLLKRLRKTAEAVAVHHIPQGQRNPELRQILDMAGIIAKGIEGLDKTKLTATQEP